MRILFIADAVGVPGRRALEERLPSLRDELRVDLCILNGENLADGVGITPKLADKMLASGVDAITLGNHTWRRSEIVPYLEQSDRVIRPANYSKRAPGKGLTFVAAGDGTEVAVLNFLGSLFLGPPYNAFEIVDELVEEAAGRTPVIVVDMHAEATSEKVALAKWLDGKVTAVFGTHTHIQTNDARVQRGGTAAITDAGMTGPHDSVIGVQADLAIRQMRTGLHVRFETASGDVRIEGALVECGSDGRATSCESVRVHLAVTTPRIRYAENGDIHIAYQVVGDGPLDLVCVMGAMTNLNVLWDDPDYRRFFERLASFSRIVLFDKRGMGLSDRVRIGTLEERMDDVRAILDAMGSDSAALLGVSEGGPMSMLFAATYPERTRAIVLCGAEVKEETTDDWPWGETTREDFDRSMDIDLIVAHWGTGDWIDHFAPSRAGDPRLRQLAARVQVESASPHDAVAFMRMAFEIDVRHVAPAVKTPTLILHRVGDQICHVENARWLSRHIEGAHYLELPGNDHLPWIDGDDILDEIQEFLTGVREPAEPDRVLATVLFTDVVGSTERARELGDRRWRDLLDRHNEIVRRDLERFRGHEVDTAGDGFFATFDGPARAIRCARSIVADVQSVGLEVRAGLHTGECELAGDQVRGIAVHTGARVASLAGPGEVLVSSTVRDLVAGSGIEFAERGVQSLKGIPGEWRLYAVA